MFVGIVLAGDTGSRTSLPGGDDDSFGDDGTSSSRCRAELCCYVLNIVAGICYKCMLAIVVRLFCQFVFCRLLSRLHCEQFSLHTVVI